MIGLRPFQRGRSPVGTGHLEGTSTRRSSGAGVLAHEQPTTMRNLNHSYGRLVRGAVVALLVLQVGAVVMVALQRLLGFRVTGLGLHRSVAASSCQRATQAIAGYE